MEVTTHANKDSFRIEESYLPREINQQIQELFISNIAIRSTAFLDRNSATMIRMDNSLSWWEDLEVKHYLQFGF